MGWLAFDEMPGLKPKRSCSTSIMPNFAMSSNESLASSKHEFKLAAEPSDYCIDTQCLIPLSLTILHNFLCAHEPNHVRNKSHTQMDGLPLTWQDNVGDYIEMMQDKGGIVHGTEEAHADERRDCIATAMWSQYQSVLAEQHNRERRD